jgi:SAM-dependent methyltransferase
MRSNRHLFVLVLVGLLASCIAPTESPGPAPTSTDLGPIVDLDGSDFETGPHAHPQPGIATSQDDATPRHSAGQFDDAEKWVQRFEGPARDAWQHPQDVVDLMGIEPGMTIADIGTGTGYFLPYLSRGAGETGTVLALDVEPGMIRHVDERVEMEELFNVRPRVVPPDDPQLPTARTDRVLIVNTWHHIAGRDRYALKLAAALSSGGAVYIVDFTPDSSMGPPASEKLPTETVVAELEKAGLQTEILTEDLPQQYIVVGRKP